MPLNIMQTNTDLNKEISFESSMLSLQKVIEKLESSSTSLDEMILITTFGG